MIRFEEPGTRAAYAADLEAVDFALTRRNRLDAAITAVAADSEFTAMTRRLCCLRGISTLTGFALAVELGDWHRFTGASIGAYLGLVPSEHSSGASRRQGGITKTGKHPHPTAADRGHLAPQAPLHRGPGHAGPVGTGHPCGPRTRTCRQPPTAPPVGHGHGPEEEVHRGQHRDRARAGRLVLVPGHPRAAGVTQH